MTVRPWEWECPYPVKLLLDSGAFSAWTREKSVDLRAYIAYIQANHDYLWSYVNLDTIPGRLGQLRTRAEIRASAEASYANQQIMRGEGLRTIPVFHEGEDFDWLIRMVEEGEDYIGISPADDLPRQVQRDWLDDCFTILTNEQGLPCVRTHGFGVLNPAPLRRYPFYSAD